MYNTRDAAAIKIWPHSSTCQASSWLVFNEVVFLEERDQGGNNYGKAGQQDVLHVKESSHSQSEPDEVEITGQQGIIQGTGVCVSATVRHKPSVKMSDRENTEPQ
ncbi:hypothetical protein Pcinc_012089 [Petrolisthes cinctipes]|uniref:Uncharacterized protein n=1 Tax=Petrolisthes cinctipes TaxID=88211 RepID=A0AAE1G1E4_PETCI|nr:hypothetical protein Pcinc_012089 [Petrolisthes cinctipes]